MKVGLKNQSKLSAVLGVCLVVTLSICLNVFGCGLDWRLPTNHFDGVNNQGYVAYWEKVNDLDLGDGLKIPIFIGFRSNKENGIPSPYLGQGWILPLLESNIVQTGDNTFLMMQPDGWNHFLLRNSSNNNILQGSAGWKAQINNDTITAWAPCGWKIAFYKGRIQSITTPKNRILEFIYSGGVATEIRENGTSKLTVERSPTGEANAIAFNGKRMQVILGQKPRVQTIAGQNVVGEIDRSLKSLNPAEGTSKSFEFAVNDKLQPTLKITNTKGIERLLTWDPVTKRIVGDDGWIYNIKTANNNAANVIVERVNTLKQKEYWFHDKGSGQEIVIGIDGIKKVKTWFTSGVLKGKIRQTETFLGDGLIAKSSCTYDEAGHLLRQIVSDGRIYQYTRTQDGSLVSEVLTQNGKEIQKRNFDKKHRVISEEHNGILIRQVGTLKNAMLKKAT